MKMGSIRVVVYLHKPEVRAQGKRGGRKGPENKKSHMLKISNIRSMDKERNFLTNSYSP